MVVGCGHLSEGSYAATMPRDCTVVRVFTRGAQGGNHLGVVTDVAGLDDHGMLDIAARLGFSETVFVEPAPGGPPFVRIFTPAEELPFAGHPLVGTAWVLTTGEPGGVDRLRYREGMARVRTDGDVTWIDVPLIGEVAPEDDARDFLTRAGIGPLDAVDRVMLPREYVMAELPDPAAVAALAPDMAVLEERFGTLAFARQDDTVRARFFAPATAVPEDPATGSAAVGLASLLSSRGEQSGRLSIDQGEEMGHPSRIELTWGDGRAAIGGSVVRDEIRVV